MKDRFFLSVYVFLYTQQLCLLLVNLFIWTDRSKRLKNKKKKINLEYSFNFTFRLKKMSFNFKLKKFMLVFVCFYSNELQITKNHTTDTVVRIIPILTNIFTITMSGGF